MFSEASCIYKGETPADKQAVKLRRVKPGRLSFEIQERQQTICSTV